jgi:WD40 repeat protein
MSSLKASPQGLTRIKQARVKKGWAVDDFRWLQSASKVLDTAWEEDSVLALGISPGTWKRFLAGKFPINTEAFKAYCQVLELNWEEVVEQNEDTITDRELSIQNPKSQIQNRSDWGEAPDVSIFYGREEELNSVRQWIVQENCRLVTLLGMGGIGKTSLSVKLAHQIQDRFECIIWRSLRNSPPIDEVLVELIQFLSDQSETNLPTQLDGKISRLLKYLRSSRCLLILDNLESILQAGDRTGSYRHGYEGYGQLLQIIGDTAHQSCLILTSREKPKGLATWEGQSLPVRSLQLSGLLEADGRSLFDVKGTFTATDDAWQILIDRYAGNPLAIKIVASSIRDFFEGDISHFLAISQQGSFLFDDIRDLLAQQFHRLADWEQQIMYWLTINREPVSLQELQADFVKNVPVRELIETLNSLQRRSLIEKSANRFTQQPVVMEYVTDRAIEQVSHEIVGEIAKINPSYLLISHALIKAQTKDYVRETQASLILQPIIDKLIAELGSPENLGKRLEQILSYLRGKSPPETGYAAGNILNLLHQARVDLTGYDFSNLTVWQAYLQGVNLHQVNFADSDLSHCVFTETLGNILSVAFSPDGQLLATCDTDCNVRLWNVQTGQLLLICQGHTHWVRSVAFSQDGQIIASGGADCTVRLWDAKTGECIRIHTDHNDEIHAVVFSPDGRFVASGSADNTIRLWDILAGNCCQILTGHTDWVRSVAFSPDGKILGSGSVDSTVRLWDAKTGECLHICVGHSGWVRSVTFSHDRETFISGSSDKTIKFWDINTGECVQTYTGHTGGVFSVALSANGQVLASGGGDKTIKFWDVNTGRIIKTLYGQTDQIFAIAFNCDGQTLATISQNQVVRLWNWQTDRCFRTLHGHTDWALPVSFSPQGNLLASGSSDQTVKLWDVTTEQIIETLSGHTDRVFSVAFSSDGEILASTGADRTVRLWDVKAGKCFLSLQGHQDWIKVVIFSPDDRTLASCCYDRTIRLWDIQTGECLKILTGHTDAIYAIAYRPVDTSSNNCDRQILASSSADKTAKLWDVQTGSCIRTFVGHLNRVFDITFSRDGKTLATASTDRTIKLWDVETGECLRTFPEEDDTNTGHNNWVYAVTFCGDGNILASASADQTVRLWDVLTGKCLKICTGHTHQLYTVTSTSDGQILATGSQDQTVRLWDVLTGKCLKILIAPRLYEGMNITRSKGLTKAQIMTLKALGAIECRG